MRFIELPLTGAFAIDLEPHRDERGFFARYFCRQEFEQRGLKSPLAQFNAGFNHRKGTVRGLHYQVAPATEVKLIRCVRGAVYEVIVDMRPESQTYLQYWGVTLSERNNKLLYVPEMFAAGHQALTDSCEIAYQSGEFYTPEYERGVRYDDPAVGVRWPLPPTLVSEKDASWPLLANSNQRGY